MNINGKQRARCLQIQQPMLTGDANLCCASNNVKVTS